MASASAAVFLVTIPVRVDLEDLCDQMDIAPREAVVLVQRQLSDPLTWKCEPADFAHTMIDDVEVVLEEEPSWDD
jgi:hypothetical protein